MDNDNLGNLSEVVRAWSERMNRDLNDMLQAMMPSSFQTEISNLFKGFEPVIAQLREVADRTTASLGEVAPYVQQAGWVMPPSASFEFIAGLQELVRSGATDVSTIGSYFIVKSEEDDFEMLRCIVESLKQKAYFSKRRAVLDDALQAHMDGKHTLSIPALIPFVEGYVASVTGIYRIGETQIVNAVRTKEITELSFLNDVVEAFISDYIFHSSAFTTTDPTREKYDDFKFHNTIPPEQVINRHGIAHGYDADYASKENSLRIFFLLDYLVFALD